MGSTATEPRRRSRQCRAILAALCVAVAISFASAGRAADAGKRPLDSADAHSQWGLIEHYCFECHNATDWAGGVAFDTMSFDTLPSDAKVWEAAVRKLRAGFMPPASAKARPDPKSVTNLLGFL